MFNSNNKHHRGIYTEIRPCLRPEQSTEYRMLIEELKNTTYKSTWRQPLSYCRDPVPGLPVGFKPYEFTCGKSTQWDLANVRELMQPFKGPIQVDDTSKPGEKLCRHYTKSFDPDRRYGKKVGFNPLGVLTKCALRWYRTDPVSVCNIVEADFKRLKTKCDPATGDAAGKAIDRPFYNLEDLIKDYNCEPCIVKRDLREWLTKFHKFDRFIKNKIDLDEYEENLLYFDTNRNNHLSLEVFYKISYNFKLDSFIKELEPFLQFLKILDNGQINYKKLLQIVKAGIELPKTDDIPIDHRYYQTTTKTDFVYPENYEKVKCLRLAGINEDDTAASLLNPDIFTNYGLSCADFHLPRNQTTIRELFERIGYKFDDETFDILWKKCGDRICVDTFYKLIKNHTQLDGDKIVLCLEKI